MTSSFTSSPLSFQQAALSLGGALAWLRRAKRHGHELDGSFVALYLRFAEEEILAATLRLPADCRAQVAAAADAESAELASPAILCVDRTPAATLLAAAEALRGHAVPGAAATQDLAARLDELAAVCRGVGHANGA